MTTLTTIAPTVVRIRETTDDGPVLLRQRATNATRKANTPVTTHDWNMP
jgi:hypothetical protein